MRCCKDEEEIAAASDLNCSTFNVLFSLMSGPTRQLHQEHNLQQIKPLALKCPVTLLCGTSNCFSLVGPHPTMHTSQSSNLSFNSPPNLACHPILIQYPPSLIHQHLNHPQTSHPTPHPLSIKSFTQPSFNNTPDPILIQVSAHPSFTINIQILPQPVTKPLIQPCMSAGNVQPCLLAFLAPCPDTRDGQEAAQQLLRLVSQARQIKVSFRLGRLHPANGSWSGRWALKCTAGGSESYWCQCVLSLV